MNKICKLLLIAILLLVTVFVIKQIYVHNIDFTKFDKELWDNYPKKRYKMIEDFEYRYPIETLNKEKVIELLGTKHMQEIGDSYSYAVKGNFNTLYYSINFDKDGICVETGFYRD